MRETLRAVVAALPLLTCHTSRAAEPLNTSD